MHKSGTIVLVPFPFTDLSGTKVRPALIIAAPKGDDVVVVFITSKDKRTMQHDVLIAPGTENGLKVASSIRCSKIATLDKKTILGELGMLGESEYKKVQKEITLLFNVS